jgi:hypothetical protein
VVDRGPETTEYERAVNYALLCKNAKGVITEHAIFEPLRAATFEGKKERRTLSRFSRITRVFAKVTADSEEGRAVADRALAWVILEPWLKKRPRQPLAKYLSQPQALAAGLRELLQALDGDPAFKGRRGARDDEVVFSWRAADVTFTAFQKARPEVAPWDTAVHQDHEHTRAERARRQFLATGATEPKDVWLQKAVLGLGDSPEGSAVLNRMASAFGQPHPLRMLREFSAAGAMLRELLVRLAPPGTEVGADQYQPSTIALVLLTAPRGLVSVYVFLHDYCGPAQFLATECNVVIAPFDYVITQTIADPGFSLQGICK